MTRPSDLILAAVSAAHLIPVETIRSRATDYCTACARADAYYRLYTARHPSGTFRWSLSQIGGFLGRDPSTVRDGAMSHARRRGLPFPRSAA